MRFAADDVRVLSRVDAHSAPADPHHRVLRGAARAGAGRRVLVRERRQFRATRRPRSPKNSTSVSACSRACSTRTPRNSNCRRACWRRDFAFREAIATHDTGTIASVLANHGARIGADAMVFVDLEGQVVSDTLQPRRAPHDRSNIRSCSSRQGRRQRQHGSARRPRVPARGGAGARAAAHRLGRHGLRGGRCAGAAICASSPSSKCRSRSTAPPRPARARLHARMSASSRRCWRTCRRAPNSVHAPGHEHLRRRSPGAGDPARRQRQTRASSRYCTARSATRWPHSSACAIRSSCWPALSLVLSIVGSVAVARNITRPARDPGQRAAARIEQGDYGAPVDLRARRRNRRARFQPQSHARQHRRSREAHSQAGLRRPAHRSRQSLALLQRARARHHAGAHGQISSSPSS